MSSKCTLSRSRSTGSLDFGSKSDKCLRLCGYNTYNRPQSELLLEACDIVGNHSHISSLEDRDAGEATRVSDEGLSLLERKINKLTDILHEQHNLLKSLNEELITSKVVLQTFAVSDKPDLVKESAHMVEDSRKTHNGSNDIGNQDSGGKNLLNALERSQVQRTDREIRDVLDTFLQSDDLKDRIATATAESIREAITTTFSETFPAAYLPVLEQSHRRLLKHVTGTLESAFNELEAGSEGLFKSVHRTSRSLRTALEKHEALLENNKTASIFDNFQYNLESILKNELKEWREKLAILLLPGLCEDGNSTNAESNPSSDVSTYPAPPQPAELDRSIIDQLMKSAKISKSIQNGDINKSFEEALSSSDLSLVVAACKAADPTKIFASPCSLKQSVLLSLVQQLATNMVHDTQLKCRYLEEAIINLNTTDQTTRTHLPLVVGEVRKHLFKFIQWYPSHVANRRINLIIMAATNLLI